MFNDRLPLLALANHMNYQLQKFKLLVDFGEFNFCLITQIVTGLVLAMHYIADTKLAFASVEHIMRDVNYDG